MKKIGLFLSLILAAIACSVKTHNVPCSNDTIARNDTVFIADTVLVHDTINVIPDEYLLYKLRVINARHYLEIIRKNPSQVKFLHGWMKRAINE